MLSQTLWEFEPTLLMEPHKVAIGYPLFLVLLRERSPLSVLSWNLGKSPVTAADVEDP